MHNRGNKSTAADSAEYARLSFAREAAAMNSLPRTIRLAFSYCRLAETYEDHLNDRAKARFYYEAALEIFDRELGKEAKESREVVAHLTDLSDEEHSTGQKDK